VRRARACRRSHRAEPQERMALGSERRRQAAVAGKSRPANSAHDLRRPCPQTCKRTQAQGRSGCAFGTTAEAHPACPRGKSPEAERPVPRPAATSRGGIGLRGRPLAPNIARRHRRNGRWGRTDGNIPPPAGRMNTAKGANPRSVVGQTRPTRPRGVRHFELARRRQRCGDRSKRSERRARPTPHAPHGAFPGATNR
jgi:hypothetical protein